MVINKELLWDFSNKFLGYGNIKAPIWFIGMEPGSPDNKKLLEKFFNVWADRNKPAIDDVKASHLQIGHSHYTRFFEKPVIYERTWGGLIKILFAIDGNNEFTIEDVKKYQRDKFGQLNSNHCILELFALPAKNIKAQYWDKHYRKHFNITKAEFFNKQLKNRISILKNLIIKNKPKSIIFYGTSYKNYWEEVAECKIDKVNIIDKKEIFYKAFNKTKYIVCYHPVAHGITNEYLAGVGKLATKK